MSARSPRARKKRVHQTSIPYCSGMGRWRAVPVSRFAKHNGSIDWRANSAPSGFHPSKRTNNTRKSCKSGADGDVDALFERVLGIRWLIIDECSTLSLSLLGLLDSRRACDRHPYAKTDRVRRPFGGLNIVFAGDLWQLPPVKGKALFSDPFHGGLSAEEQKTANFLESGITSPTSLPLNCSASH